MQKIIFVETLDGVQVDLLVLRDQILLTKIDKELQGAISHNLKRGKMPVWMTTNGAYPIPKIVVVGHHESWSSFAEERIAFAISDRGVEELAFEVASSCPQAKSLLFICSDAKKAEANFQRYRSLLEGIRFAKELIDAPSNLMPPSEFANRCRSLERQGVVVDVLEEDRLKEVGAEALLAVGKGSCNPPRMVVMEWRGSKDDPIVLLGKGVCFDAGGIQLKTSYLVEMKWDKAGAGLVAGVMDALSKMKAPISVVGIVVLAENMPDGAALKPADVIQTLGGKTVEIIDTDCEGRLMLADGLSYAQKRFSPKAIIDLATLTLETFGALGGEYAGLFCNDSELENALIQAGIASGEKLWSLPLGDYFAKQLHSRVADLKNVGLFRYGGSSAAAEFLRAFVAEGLPWAHIDIAGTSWNLYKPEDGVTGFGVRLLVEFLLQKIKVEKTPH